MDELARILVQERVLTQPQVDGLRKAARDGDLASAALDRRLADERGLVRALARLHECPGVDFSRSALPTSVLDVIAAGLCAERGLLPLDVSKSELKLAMVDPEDLVTADEVRFFTGKRVVRCVAVALALRRALEGLVLARGEGRVVLRGGAVPALPDAATPHLALWRPGEPVAGLEVPEASQTMELVELAAAHLDPSPLEAGLAPAAPRPVPLAVPRVPAPSARPFATAVEDDRPTVRVVGIALGKVALVADDDAAVRQLVATVLRTMGCVVLEAGDGLAALSAAREARPDVAVLDAMMPGMHGFEVCRAMKGDRSLRTIRVVLCSAIYRGTVGADAQVAFGADAFVEKPFRLEELSRVLKVALVGPVAAETPEERAAREAGQKLWHGAAAALVAGQVPEAARLARDAASADPWSAEAHYYLGHALARQGLLLEAVAAYERAAELRPDVDATHQCLAQLHERLGFQKSARESWARAIETCKDAKRRKGMQARLLALLGVG